MARRDRIRFLRHFLKINLPYMHLSQVSLFDDMHCMPSGLATKAEGRGADVEANKTDRQRGSRDRASERPAGRPAGFWRDIWTSYKDYHARDSSVRELAPATGKAEAVTQGLPPC